MDWVGQSKWSGKSMVFGIQQELCAGCLRSLLYALSILPHPALPYKIPGPSPGFSHWGVPWLEGKERKEVKVFVPCEISRAPHPIPSLTAPALNNSVLTSLPLFLVPGDNDGCVDTSLELLLHTCHAFVTSPFLNKRTSPWIAPSRVCHVFSTGTLPSSNPSLCYSLGLGPWPGSLTSLRLNIFICKTDKPGAQAHMSGTRQVSQACEVGVCLTRDLSLVPSLAVPENRHFDLSRESRNLAFVWSLLIWKHWRLSKMLNLEYQAEQNVG